MAFANRQMLRASVLLVATFGWSNALKAQEGDQRAKVDYSAAMARSSNGFAFQFIPDPYTVPAGTPVNKLLPKPPRFKALLGPVLSGNLMDVPEVAFADPLPGKAPAGVSWKDHFKHNRDVLLKQIAHMSHLDEKRADGFMEAMLAQRADLSGLPFILGDGCRMEYEQCDFFVRAACAVRDSLQTSNRREVGEDGVKEMWETLRGMYAKEDSTADFSVLRDRAIPARIAALTQILAPLSPEKRVGLAQYLRDIGHVDATRALARLAIYSQEQEVREAAIESLKTRREKDYTPVFLQGLRYPWPQVAKRAAEAIVELKCDSLLPQLVDLLDEPDPRQPISGTNKGKPSKAVRELVKINHLRNCMLCHPAHGPDEVERFAPPDSIESLAVGALPVPGEFFEPYSVPKLDLFVRGDVTYLRQDFSVMLPVRGADFGPEQQRFDFVVRTRLVSEKEAEIFRDKLAKRGLGAVTPYERAILYALRELTGRDTEPTAAAWRKILEVPSPR
jgi:hypothetical protein